MPRRAGRSLAEDIQAAGGIITEEDLAGYEPVWGEPVSVRLDRFNMTVHGVPPPGSGAVLAGILNIMDNYDIG